MSIYKKLKLIKVVNDLIPFPGFMAMMVMPFLFIRRDYEASIDKYVINHETIHYAQQLEILILGIILAAICCLVFPISWWWMFASLGFYYVIYVLCWIIELVLPPMKYAYKNICFESEAQYNEGNLKYLESRKPFAWVKYISNKKYPPLNYKSQRIALWN